MSFSSCASPESAPRKPSAEPPTSATKASNEARSRTSVRKGCVERALAGRDTPRTDVQEESAAALATHVGADRGVDRAHAFEHTGGRQGRALLLAQRRVELSRQRLGEERLRRGRSAQRPVRWKRFTARTWSP